MNQSALLRPDWTPATIALMILGFVVFWPLGLAMLAYILFGERLRGWKRDVNQAADGMFSGCRRSHGRYRSQFGTGNVAFDDWRKAELDRLEEERRKLDEMRADFDNYVRELRRAKDQEEFDRFMRERNNRNSVKRDDNGPAPEFQTP
jgi:biopolymer transport protein ExbB/TolQ